MKIQSEFDSDKIYIGSDRHYIDIIREKKMI
jgi:hypothetical protein